MSHFGFKRQQAAVWQIPWNETQTELRSNGDVIRTWNKIEIIAM